MAPDNCPGLGGRDVTTHAPLRSRRTKAKSVYRVQRLGAGDFPPSPLKIQGCRQSAPRRCSAPHGHGSRLWKPIVWFRLDVWHLG